MAHLNVVANKTLSSLANVLYWQGFNDELRVAKIAERKLVEV